MMPHPRCISIVLGLLSAVPLTATGQAGTGDALRVSCADLTVEPRATMPCTATIHGQRAGRIEWTVNNIPGGSERTGRVGSDGLYSAPEENPGATRVNIGARDLDSQNRASTPLFVAKVLASATDHVTASDGGVIALDNYGTSVRFPPGALLESAEVKAQLISSPIQPTNGVFHGVGPSLLIRFYSRSGMPLTGQVFRRELPQKLPLIFQLPTSGQLSDDQVKSSLGALDVNDGNDNYFALPPRPQSGGAVSLEADPSMAADPAFLQAGLTHFVPQRNHSGTGWMQTWNAKDAKFADAPAGFCPKGPRTVILVHGMLSSPESAYNPDSGATWAKVTGKKYGSVIAFDYKWWGHIQDSAAALAGILNRYADRTGCDYQGTFEIEGHSEGTAVILTSMIQGPRGLTAGTMTKIRHIVLVAGPVEGTPLAKNAVFYLTAMLNVPTPKPWTVLVPGAVYELLPFIEQLQPGSSLLKQAEVGAGPSHPAPRLIAVAGDKGFLAPGMAAWGFSWVWSHALLNGVPNDGVVPVSSALLQNLRSSNLTRLAGNDPHLGDSPYALNHTSLVNDRIVMDDIETVLH